eukprot:1346737-Rhodomonas_salina.6
MVLVGAARWGCSSTRVRVCSKLGQYQVCACVCAVRCQGRSAAGKPSATWELRLSPFAASKRQTRHRKASRRL